MIDLSRLELWFVTGSQSLYGEATLTKVSDHSREIVHALSTSAVMPVKIICQPVMTTPESVRLVFNSRSGPAVVASMVYMAIAFA